jgi:hypothetical protein
VNGQRIINGSPDLTDHRIGLTKEVFWAHDRSNAYSVS